MVEQRDLNRRRAADNRLGVTFEEIEEAFLFRHQSLKPRQHLAPPPVSQKRHRTSFFCEEQRTCVTRGGIKEPIFDRHRPNPAQVGVRSLTKQGRAGVYRDGRGSQAGSAALCRARTTR